MAVLYNDSEDFSVILKNVHNAMIAKMKRNTAKREALELQSILMALKIAAKDFNKVSDSIIGNNMESEFYELIQTAYQFQSQYHGKGFQPSTLFHRADARGKRIAKVKEADSIFEEDLAAILAAGEFLGGNTSITMESFLVGGQSSGTRATQAYKNMNLSNLADEAAEELIKKLADIEHKKAATQIGNATGKIDISGKAITLNYTKELPFSVERLLVLMKDATFSAKNYNSKAWSEDSKKELSALGLHLGHTNLYKAVTGALSEVQMGHKQQASMFFRGMNTILYNNHGYAEQTRTHFNHLRFIYELRGSGLLDQNGLVLPVKYLIYNDPSSDAIFVKDTASIILEALESASRADNLLGEVSIAASKVQSI